MTNKQVAPSARALLARAHSLKNEEETKALYRDWATSYDATMVEGLGYLSPVKGAKLLNAHVSNTNAAILDVGTGTGLVGKELAAFGYTAIDGIDYSAQMLEMAASGGYYQTLMEADLNAALALDDNSYDAMICIGTFTHGHVGADCLDELFRVLKPGGKFITAIRLNYWEPAGFATKVQAMSDKGMLKTLHQLPDSNYANSEAPESWFIVWEKV